MKNTFKPILFNTEMVQAILNGQKTQTRRTKGLEIVNDGRAWEFVAFGLHPEDESIPGEYAYFNIKGTDTWCYIKMPVVKNTVFWVRETFALWCDEYLYRADYIISDIELFTWKPSIHMPKRACRLFLKVNNIRIERLQDISEKDAVAEGITKHSDFGSTGFVLYTEPDAAYTDIDAISSFESLWVSIYDQNNWDANPFVWVYTFERIEKPSDFI